MLKGKGRHARLGVFLAARCPCWLWAAPASAADAARRSGEPVPRIRLGRGVQGRNRRSTRSTTRAPAVGRSQSPPTVQPLDGSCIRPTPAGHDHDRELHHDVVTEVYPTGASVGITQVCSEQLGRRLRAHDACVRHRRDCTGLHFVAYARDGLAWECFGTCHNVTNLTKAQLQGIYGDCSITNWSQVGGTPGPIKVYAVQAGSGHQVELEQVPRHHRRAALRAGRGPHHPPEPERADPGERRPGRRDLLLLDRPAHTRTSRPVGDGSSLEEPRGLRPEQRDAHRERHVPARLLPAEHVLRVARPARLRARVRRAPRVKQYIGETGWICKADSTDDQALRQARARTRGPGVNYRQEIEDAIRADGFAPLTYGPTGGSTPGSSFCREFDH